MYGTPGRAFCGQTHLLLSLTHLCIFLSLSLLMLQEHTSHWNCHWTSWCLLRLSLYNSRLVCGSPGRSRCGCHLIPLTLPLTLITSLHLFLGPHRGHGWGNHPKRMDLGIPSFSIIWARWPSHHSSVLFWILSVTFSMSPHLVLISVIMICSDYCCLFEIPNIILIQWWREAVDLFLVLLEQYPALCAVQQYWQNTGLVDLSFYSRSGSCL